MRKRRNLVVDTSGDGEDARKRRENRRGDGLSARHEEVKSKPEGRREGFRTNTHTMLFNPSTITHTPV